MKDSMKKYLFFVFIFVSGMSFAMGFFDWGVEFEECASVGEDTQKKSEEVLCVEGKTECSDEAKVNTLRMKLEKLNSDMRRLKEKGHDSQNYEEISRMNKELSSLKEYMAGCFESVLSEGRRLDSLMDMSEMMAEGGCAFKKEKG